ncbi:malto-oligosyltrehalose synthase [Devosia nitrariae]|uniref:malto-oligosyltrehalose synthase n=1 Tax=Devosia nitrariae TaxID=2071872 RepID=UPI0024E0BABD|nr:malto-oligosyltrehalose synthase [Devosia nitrariae]
MATYRIQLRDGVGFAEVEARLDYLHDLGISHLYLSPIMTAASGSKHGYDIIDPTRIDPVLGGREGYERLARAAIGKDIGIILDIVPNHTAFSLENPWLRDVLIKGPKSRWANHFDIDWRGGYLVLPILPEPFEKMLGDGRFAIEGGEWVFDDTRVPLSPAGEPVANNTDSLRQLHEAQHWRLRHWESERDTINHRRFFNVTSLIGMRVEDRKVFEDTHRLIFDLVRQGLVHGLRVDHVDGLADPKGYLAWLAEALPDTPVWVEKILVGQEELPRDWNTVGTTGYEAARLIARLLTSSPGLARVDAEWRRQTGIADSFEQALGKAKREVLENELAAELNQLVALAHEATRRSPRSEPGPESLREAILALLEGMARYRTYVDADGASQSDRELIAEVVRGARARLRSTRVTEHLADILTGPAIDAERALATRFQQVSGALLAKAQEDTVGFRWTRYIAANEVGAVPEEAVIGDAEANWFLALRRPSDMTLTSSHDTKRSEDARMRLVAISHHPDAFATLVADAGELPDAAGVEPKWRWYVVQSALAIWGDAGDAVSPRLVEHLRKAMREAKETTFWTRPVDAVEGPAFRFAQALCARWAETSPGELATLIACGETLSLMQLALKCLMPGFPDFYRGAEGSFYALTDPDNRLPVDWTALSDLASGEGFAGEKFRLTRRLLALRREERAFFDQAGAELSIAGNQLTLSRAGIGRRLTLRFGPSLPTPPGALWKTERADNGIAIFWES